ncbi:MAG TPA: PadR family transcriptional regulator [Symbiobacteriaceae bacterium]|nr:PadR family transcriptional regulator [Symbiobacteriaceae bacterium]
MEWTILGLLADTSQTGYDILRVFRTSPAMPWRSSSGSVYPALKHLVSLGLAASSEGATEAGRNSVTYTITPGGKEKLLSWLESPLAETMPGATTDVLIRLLFAHHGRPGVLRRVLTEYENLIRSALAPAEETLNQCCRCLPVHQQYCLTNGVMSLQAQLQWVQTVLNDFPIQSAGGSGTCQL